MPKPPTPQHPAVADAERTVRHAYQRRRDDRRIMLAAAALATSLAVTALHRP